MLAPKARAKNVYNLYWIAGSVTSKSYCNWTIASSVYLTIEVINAVYNAINARDRTLNDFEKSGFHSVQMARESETTRSEKKLRR